MDAPCPGLNTLVDLAGNRLTGDRLGAAQKHLDHCADCRGLVAEAVLAETLPASGPDGPASDAPTREQPGPASRVVIGTVIGRYVVERFLGAGGMGVVYVARDPQLGRKVAVKLIRAAASDTGEVSLRLLREAQALARAQHPNVVAVHDSGVFDGQVFIAMELVDGVSLRQWLVEQPRTWREIVTVFIDAGRGLAAVHAAGLIHRDFKPDNVLVAATGEVRIVDFGLARLTDAVHPAASPSPGIEGDPAGLPAPLAGLTRTGSVLGTPAFMAPEQFLGAPADARTDQFSFCVALHLAVFGELPFGGTSVAELKAEVLSGRVRRTPIGKGPPRRLRTLLARGLGVDPAARHPDMVTLCRALEAIRDRRLARRTTVVAAAVLAAAAVVGASPVIGRGGALTAGVCDGTGDLPAVWNPDRRARIERAFRRAGPVGASSFVTLVAAIDARANELKAARSEVCQATYLRGEQSSRRLDERMDCLDTRLGELDSFLGTMTMVDPAKAAAAPATLAALPPLAECDDPAGAARNTEPEGLGSGLISDFDDGTAAARFGLPWSAVSDQMFGGASTVAIAPAAGGANGTAGSLEVSGEIALGSTSARFAGAIFFPGRGSMQPVNLSRMRRVRLWARGDGRGYGLLLFSKGHGTLPVGHGFRASDGWQELSFELESFAGIQPFDITGVMVSASEDLGRFRVEIDEVRFEP